MATVPAALVTILIGFFDSSGKHVNGISRFWAWMMLAVGGVSLKVNGLTHLNPKQQYVFMVNHQSNFDIPVLIQSLPEFQLRWIAKRELLWVPLFGWAMWAARHIMVNRSDRSDALGVLKNARKQIARGISVVVFPEGTRTTDGHLLPFKRGGFLLAVKTKTPIVPVTINGSGRILPKGDWRIRPGEIEVTVGEPIAVENYRPETVRGLPAQVYERIAKHLPPSLQTAVALSGQGEPAIAAPLPNREPNLMRKRWNH